MVSHQSHRRSRTARRTALAVGAVLALGGLACVPLRAQASPGGSARTVTVAADGSAAYRTIQAAIDAASPRDTISVAKGRVEQVYVLNTCVTGVRYPLVFDTHYANGSGSDIPSFTGITVAGLRAVNSPANAQSVVNGYSAAHPLELTLSNVSLDRNASTASYAKIAVHNSTITPSGTGVAVTQVSGGGLLPSCSFPAYPAL